MYYDLMMLNVAKLTNDLREVVGFVPSIWGILIKHLIPPLLLVLFFLGADAFFHYGGYANQPYQVLGLMTVVFSGFLFLSGLVLPQMYDSLVKSDDQTVVPPPNHDGIEMKTEEPKEERFSEEKSAEGVIA